MDNEKLVPGTPIWEKELEKAIKSAFAIVVVLSPDSKNSEWVLREVTLADQFRKRVFPVLVTGSEEDSIPLRLITRQFVDVRTNEDAGFHSLKTAISFYLEELAAQEEKEREEAAKLARAEEERKAAEREAERLRLENEAKEKAAREAEEKAAKERTEKEAFKRDAIRLDLERKAAEEKERIATEKASREAAEREAAEQEAAQLKTEKATAQKNIFSRIGYAWAGWSRGKKILLILGISTLLIMFACVGYIASEFAKDILRPYAPIQLVLPEEVPNEIPPNMQPRSIYDIEFSPDGKSLASAGSSTVSVLNVADGSLIRDIKSYGFAIDFSPDGHTLAATSSSSIDLWNIDDLEGQPTSLTGHTETVWTLAFSTDGRLLASGSSDDTIRIWDINTNETLITLSGHTDDVKSVAFSPDDKYLASGSDDDTIRIWTVETGELIHTFKNNPADYRSSEVIFSNDGKTIITVSIDGIQLWDTSTYQLITTISDERYLEGIAISPDDKFIASSTSYDEIMVWDAVTDELVQTFGGHTENVTSVAFSPDGTLIASGAWDGTVRLWEINP